MPNGPYLDASAPGRYVNIVSGVTLDNSVQRFAGLDTFRFTSSPGSSTPPFGLTVPSHLLLSRFGAAGDYTFDCHVRTATNSLGQQIVVDIGNNNVDSGITVGYYGSERRILVSFNGAGTLISPLNSTPVFNNFFHLAVEREGNLTKIRIDGVVVATSTAHTAILPATGVFLGEDNGDSGFASFNGWLSEPRFTLADRWPGTSTIAPPTAPNPTNSIDDPFWPQTTMLIRPSIFLPEVARALATPAGKITFNPTWPVAVKQPVLPRSLFNLYHGGRGRISGTVKVKGTPNYAVYRKVRLVRERDGICVAEQWSNPVTGAYQFDYFDEREKYTVITYDYENNFRAVIADNLTPDLI